MKVGFISYWGIEDPLCVSTVMPHIDFLLKDDRVSKVFLLTFERERLAVLSLGAKFTHLPVLQKRLPLGLSFFLAYLKVGLKLRSLHRREGLDLLICRSVFAGVLGHWFCKLGRVPYTVESFEPHADYMVDNGVWSKLGWKTLLIRYFERAVSQTAYRLYPVALNFAESLVEKGVPPEKIEVLPCTANESTFAFSASQRDRLRGELGIDPSAVVGIYVGKFGGIYLESEAVEVLKGTLVAFQDSRLIVLCDPKDPMCQRIERDSFLRGRTQIHYVAPARVSNYLSAADFGFALIRPTGSSKYCSPIKLAEYWANGLPVVITKGIGDDSALIAKHNLGIVLDSDEYNGPSEEKLVSLRSLVEERRSGGTRIRDFCKLHRSQELSSKAYRSLISNTQRRTQSK